MSLHLIKREQRPNGRAPQALFDASHGQPNWAQTGFSSRELHTNFAGLTELLCHLGFECRSTVGQALAPLLRGARLLVIPPPVGRYEARRERWRRQPHSLFNSDEVRELLGFLHGGGRLLAFAYRFGDSFTQTNLGDLCLALGCRLNDDVVIDVRALRQTDPLHLHFDTPAASLPPGWARTGVSTVSWRPVATFTLLPGATAAPLALSTGGTCLSFDRTLRRICFASLPIAVCGQHGSGRFALFGGPHVFESSPLGLLGHTDNQRLLHNVMAWLLADGVPADWPVETHADAPSSPFLRELIQVEGGGEAERTIMSVERVLRKAGVLKALSRAQWMP